MYDDDEEDLALLQQYEMEGADSSNDDLDSDLEDKIMSAVQYETDVTRNWSTSSQQGSNPTTDQQATRTTIPPTTTAQSTFDPLRPDDDSSVSSLNSDDNNGEINDPIDNAGELNLGTPPVIRHIDLNITDKQLQQDDATDDEEEALNHELQQLIDQQIRQRKNRHQPPRRPYAQTFCFSCLSPGHIQRDCSMCSDCGGERHPSGTCPGVYYCYKCKERGHYAMDCRNKRCFDSCQHCGDEYHASQWCPKLVHVYKHQVSPQQTVGRYCYNCGGKGHYGDECPSLSESAQSQLSVFSFNSLSISEDPRRQHRHHGSRARHSASQPSKRHRSDNSRHFHHQVPIHQRFDNYTDSDDDRPAKKANRNTRRKEHNIKRPQEHRKGKHGNRQQDTERGSGNNNWKALTKTSTSKTTPGYTNNDTKIENDFPRNLPKPSFSGVINTEQSHRRPKYTGGYNRQ